MGAGREEGQRDGWMEGTRFKLKSGQAEVEGQERGGRRDGR